MGQFLQNGIALPLKKIEFTNNVKKVLEKVDTRANNSIGLSVFKGKGDRLQVYIAKIQQHIIRSILI